MAGKVRLFVYGLLKPQYDQPKSATDVQHDAVKGKLYDIKKDAAMTDVGDPKAPWSRGFSMLVDAAEVKKIDKMELPEYRKKKVETWAGHAAYCYEYDRDLPKGATEVKVWTLQEKHRGRKGYEAKPKK